MFSETTKTAIETIVAAHAMTAYFTHSETMTCVSICQPDSPTRHVDVYRHLQHAREWVTFFDWSSSPAHADVVALRQQVNALNAAAMVASILEAAIN